MAVPGQVTGLTLTSMTPVIKLTWTAVSASPAVTSYKVYRGTSPGGETLLCSVDDAQVTFHDQDLVSGTTYYYKVSAVNSDGEGAQSSEVNGSVTLASCRFQLRSYTDLAMKGDAVSGGNFLLPLNVVEKLNEGDQSTMSVAPNTGGTAQSCMVGDTNGVSREITITGERKDGELTWCYGSASGTDNASWVEYMRGLLAQLQLSVGPFRLVLITDPVTLIPQKQPSSNYYVYVEDFKYEYDNEYPTVVSYTLKLVLGASL